MSNRDDLKSRLEDLEDVTSDEDRDQIEKSNKWKVLQYLSGFLFF